MKRILCSLAVVSIAASAHAAPSTSTDDFFFKPYVGADYQYSQYGNKNIGTGVKSDNIVDTGLNGGDIHIGARVHQYLGFELGYGQTEEGKKSAAGYSIGGVPLGETKVQVKSATLDAMGYYPVAPKTELIGTVGISHADANLNLSPIGSSDKSEWKPRIGAGAQYWLTDNLNARALVRYQDADFGSTTNNIIISTVGLNYQF